MSVISTETKKMSLKGYLHDVMQELKKVSWTTRDELILSTKIVLGSTLFFALAVYGVDLAIHSGLQLLNYLTRTIVG